MTNKELKSKVMSLGNRLAARGQNRSAAFVRAWQKVKADMACSDMDFASLVFAAEPVRSSKPLVLDLRYSGDLGKLRGMIAREIATGQAYAFSVKAS